MPDMVAKGTTYGWSEVGYESRFIIFSNSLKVKAIIKIGNE